MQNSGKGWAILKREPMTFWNNKYQRPLPCPQLPSIKVKVDLHGLRSSDEDFWNRVKTRVEREGTVSKARPNQGVICTSWVLWCSGNDNVPGGPPPTVVESTEVTVAHSETHPCICARAMPPTDCFLPMTCFWGHRAPFLADFVWRTLLKLCQTFLTPYGNLRGLDLTFSPSFLHLGSD